MVKWFALRPRIKFLVRGSALTGKSRIGYQATMARIALLGDVMLGRGVAQQLDSTPPPDLWAPELRELLLGCDTVVCNLECCLSRRGQPTTRIPAKPFFFRAPPAAIDALNAIGVAAVGLANNHALDFEEEALLDTLELLRGAGVEACGAGANLEAARAAKTISAGDLVLGMVAAADHPAEYAAAADAPGIAHADLAAEAPAWLLNQLAELRRRADLVLAFLHWGPNMTVRPAAWQQRLADQLLEAGADAVAGHSSHAFHGIGIRPGGVAAYDLGGALDDYAVHPRYRNDLGLCAIWSPGNGDGGLELVGLRLRFSYTEIAGGPDADWIASRLSAACGELGTQVERTAEARFRIEAA
jgi:poly-gamma-glutamate capsule biosynthesis protein CapA/YwtB (metallophosphatase superfamily)